MNSLVGNDRPNFAWLAQSLSGKLHNMSNTLPDIQVEGVAGWKTRMAMTKNGQADKQLWYYGGCLEVLSTEWRNPMLIRLASAVRQLRDQVKEEG